MEGWYASDGDADVPDVAAADGEDGDDEEEDDISAQAGLSGGVHRPNVTWNADTRLGSFEAELSPPTLAPPVAPSPPPPAAASP